MENNEIIDIAPKRGRPKGARDIVPRKQRQDRDVVLVEPGDISKMVAFEMQWDDLPKVDTSKLDQVLDRIKLYFEACQTWDMRPGVAGLCSALGIGRTTWYYWVNGGRRPEYKKYLEPINARLESLMEQYGLQGKLNPATQIFFLKNHFGYKDVNDVVLVPPKEEEDIYDLDDPYSRKRWEERLQRKYLDRGYEYDQYSGSAANEAKSAVSGPEPKGPGYSDKK